MNAFSPLFRQPPFFGAAEGVIRHREVRELNSILVRHKWEPYVWLLPSILLMTIFVVFPIGIVFKLAFSEIS